MIIKVHKHNVREYSYRIPNQSRLRKAVSNKFIKAVSIALALLTFLYPCAEIFAQQDRQTAASSTFSSVFDVIYEKKESYTLTSGAEYENIIWFTTQGWLNINVIRVDMTNPYVKLDATANTESIQKLTTVPSLAASKNAVGAINGSFFNWAKTTGLNSPIGPLVESGIIRTANSDFNRYGNSMATFAVDTMNQILYEYWKTSIKLIKEDGASFNVERYNVQLNNSGDLTVFDRHWSNTSIGYSGNTDIVEMVVDNNTVVEIRKNLPAVEIPKQGFVAVAAGKNTSIITDNFKVGDMVSLNITTNPDWNNISMAITGGAIIVKNGVIPDSFSHNSPGRSPRTAIGSTKDGNRVIMVTVDGRQQNGLGVTLHELAALMLELGTYNALNLDGGGSTTMVARQPGTNNLEVVNNPSDGMPRKVGNAVTVISTAPASELAGLIIETEDKNVFVNTSRVYTVRGYDKYFNPVSVDLSQVKWSVTGIEGRFEGNVFYPTSVGSGKIIATVGNITAEHEVNSLSSPVQLILSDKSVSVQVNSTKKLTVKGKNRNGYYAIIDPKDVRWEVAGDIGTIKDGTFTATAAGQGYIEASVGDVKAYCRVKTAYDVVVVVDDFEKINGSYLSYPENIPGKYELSTEYKRSGNYSGKLTYDFNDSTGSRASYLLFSNGGYKLDNNVQKIGVWVYNTHPNPNWLRALIYDANKKAYYVDFTQNLDWTGWKYVEASLPNVSDKPLTLARIYLVQTRDVPDAGSIYLDDLTFIYNPEFQEEDIDIPEDTVPVDEANRAVVYKEDSDSFRFAVFSQSKKTSNQLEKLLLFRLSTKINSYIDAAVYIGDNSEEAARKVGKPNLTVNTGTRALDIKNSRFIQLDTSKQGLRATEPNQWKWFLKQIESFKGDNIFIFMEDSPRKFSDKLEAELFQDILTEYRQKTGKNIWVFYKDTQNTSYMERGIKYISTVGMDVKGLDPSKTDLVQYILVVVKGNEITFEFKPVVP